MSYKKNIPNIVLGAVGLLLMGCQRQYAGSQRVEPSVDSKVANVEMVAGSQAFYLRPDELAMQMKLAKAGDAKAAMRVANYYEFIERSSQKKYGWMRMAAEYGDIVAMQNVANYLESNGGQENCDAALGWLERAKREGTPEQVKKLYIDESIAALKANVKGCKV